MGKRLLKAVKKMIGEWSHAEQTRQTYITNTALQHHLANQYNSQVWPAFGQLAQQGVSNQASTTWAATSVFGQSGSGAFGMGGAPSTGYAATSGTFAAPFHPVPMTDEQLDRLLQFLEGKLECGWTCPNCQKVYAPLTPDCEFCNLVMALEGERESMP